MIAFLSIIQHHRMSSSFPISSNRPTSILRPSTTAPCNFSRAASASSHEANVTKPKPYEEKKNISVTDRLWLSDSSDTLDPRSLKMISVSTISPNCCERKYERRDHMRCFLRVIVTSNIALRSSSRNRKGIFDTCKRLCVAFDPFVLTLPVVDDEPLGVIVLVDWGE